MTEQEIKEKVAEIIFDGFPHAVTWEIAKDKTTQITALFKEYLKENNYVQLHPDQSLLDVSSVTDEQEKLAHCCQWADRDWYYAGQAEGYLRLTNTRYLGNTCWRRVILPDENSQGKEVAND